MIKCGPVAGAQVWNELPAHVTSSPAIYRYALQSNTNYPTAMAVHHDWYISLTGL